MSLMAFGLTGGIASGKSTVTRLFREEGVPMVDADEVAREVVSRGASGLKLLVEAFGPSILADDGSLDRPKLGALVFVDKQKRALLDDILGPLISGVVAHRVESFSKDYGLVGVDAALLIEKGLHGRYNPVVVVAASEEAQVARLMARDGFNEAEARARLAAQLPLAEKLKAADFTIWNNEGLVELNRQALEVLAQLRKLTLER